MAKSRHRGWLAQNEPRSCEAATGITSEFSEWFELAKAQGLLKLARDRRLMIQDPTGQWIPLESLLNVAGLWVSEERASKMTLQNMSIT